MSTEAPAPAIVGPYSAEHAELIADLETAIAASDIPDADKVTVVGDARRISSGHLGAGVVVVLPAPALEWPDRAVTRVTWNLIVVVRPSKRIDEDAARLGLLVSVIASAIDLAEAEPTAYESDAEEFELPGYRITTAHRDYL